MRLTLSAMLLAGLCCSGMAAARAQEEPGWERTVAPLESPQLSKEQRLRLFELRRSMEQKSHQGRITILQSAERCVSSASTPENFKACEAQERQARMGLREQLRSEAQQLRQQYGLPEMPKRKEWQQRQKRLDD
jgi:hypothetical protein